MYALTLRGQVTVYLVVIKPFMAELLAFIHNLEVHCIAFKLKKKVDLKIPVFLSGDKMSITWLMPQL